MPFEVVEADTVPGNVDNVVKELTQAVAARAVDDKKPADSKQTQAPDSGQQSNDEWTGLPDKLKGKSAREIALMYQNLESTYGRMANDLGQQRKLTDRLLDLKRSEDLANNGGGKPPKPVIDLAKLLEDPTAALTEFTEAREAARESEATARLAALETSLAQQQFVQKHPDYETIAQDPGFVEWVQATPYRVRTATAAYHGDWQAADDILTEYKASRPAGKQGSDTSQKPDSSAAEAAAVQAARQASLETSSNAAGDSTKGGKIFRRADLLELKLTKPDVYYEEGFQREIMAAYRDGRVK